ncbi:MAG: ATP-binding protein [Candidatus Viridilinea halotolerans]|uniref:ATP-binding protein n=1 Tax=Candidatus Viridilinea halotolerans TaxID=2491704 RepID=A0A426U613_9CHLR|nr:MAG: ATP-binding protein [Candidatus Viridilinea halotolerans]
MTTPMSNDDLLELDELLADNANQPQIGDMLEKLIGKIICLPTGTSPSFLEMHVRLNPSTPSLSPGTWVSVETTNDSSEPRRTLGRVVNTWEHNPHEDAQGSLIGDVLPFNTVYAQEGESTVIYRITEIEPMEEAIINNEGAIVRIEELSTLPRAGANVYAASDIIVTAALGLANDPELGLEIGTLRSSGEPPIPAILTRSAIQRHIFIGGGIGSGKSYTRGVIAEELYALGVPQVNIDVNGEMIDATHQLGGINLVPGKDGFTLPLSSLTAQDVIDAIPGLRSGTNIETLISYAHEELLKNRTLAKAEYFGVEDLVDEIDLVAPVLEMKAANTLRPAMQRAYSLNRISYIGKPFDWDKYIKPGALINIDCRGMLVSDIRLIVASIARDLQRLARKDNNLFVAFSIDEFHLVAPNDDKSVTTQVLREIARIGRHYKIGLILTTQSPQDVDRSILKRLLTRFLHAIEPDQLDALRGVFSDASETLVKTLPKLPQGTCIVTGAFETIRHAAVVNIRKRKTIHGGKTPDIWSDFVSAGWQGKRDINILEDSRDQ